jgi:hypothetical protein
MSDRTGRADQGKGFDAVVTTAGHAGAVPETSGHTMAVLASNHRVVLKNGRVSGGRACALSVRVAARGICASLASAKS